MSMRNGMDQHLFVEEADKRMESAGEIPFANEEIEAMVRSATREGTPPPRKLRLMPDHGVCNKLAALLLATAILFGLCLLMSMQGKRITFPERAAIQSSATAGISPQELRAWGNGYSGPNGSQPAPRKSTPANPFPGHPTEQP